MSKTLLSLFLSALCSTAACAPDLADLVEEDTNDSQIAEQQNDLTALPNSTY